MPTQVSGLKSRWGRPLSPGPLHPSQTHASTARLFAFKSSVTPGCQSTLAALSLRRRLTQGLPVCPMHAENSNCLSLSSATSDVIAHASCRALGVSGLRVDCRRPPGVTLYAKRPPLAGDSVFELPATATHVIRGASSSRTSKWRLK
jgi:hypothetical protein